MTDFTPPSLAAAIEASMDAKMPYLVAAMPGAEVEERPDRIRYSCAVQHPVVNGVLRTRLDSDSADAEIRAGVAYFAELKRPMLWWVGPGSRPGDLEQRLLGCGFGVVVELPGMALDLRTFRKPAPPPPGVRIVQVTDAAGLENLRAVTSASFALPADVNSAIVDATRVRGLDNPAYARHYVAIRDHAPVGSASLVYAAGIPGLYGVGTVPDARRQGIAAAMTSYCLEAARADGYGFVTLTSSEMGYSVYSRLGFKEYCKIRGYRPSPAA